MHETTLNNRAITDLYLKAVGIRVTLDMVEEKINSIYMNASGTNAILGNIANMKKLLDKLGSKFDRHSFSQDDFEDAFSRMIVKANKLHIKGEL